MTKERATYAELRKMLEVMRFEVRHDEHRHAIEQLLERATAEPAREHCPECGDHTHGGKL